jgi:hypothetical protein
MVYRLLLPLFVLILLLINFVFQALNLLLPFSSSSSSSSFLLFLTSTIVYLGSQRAMQALSP